MNMVGGGGVNYLEDALLIVRGYPPAQAYMTKGDLRIDPYGFWTDAPTDYKVWLFIIPASMFDSQNAWTVTMRTVSRQATAQIIIDSTIVYEMTMTFSDYLIENGVVKTGLTLANQRSASNLTTGSDDNGDYINLHSAASASSYDTAAFTTEIDVTNYNYLVFRGMARGYYSANSCPAFGLLNVINSGGSASTWTVSKMIRDNGGGSLPSSPSVLVLDISSYSGSYKIGFQEAGSGGNSWQGDARCYDLYLTNENPTT